MKNNIKSWSYIDAVKMYGYWENDVIYQIALPLNDKTDFELLKVEVGSLKTYHLGSFNNLQAVMTFMDTVGAN